MTAPTPAAPLSQERVRDIEQMLSAVTPGPWSLSRGRSVLYAVADCGAVRVEADRAVTKLAKNAEFIAASPTIVCAVVVADILRDTPLLELLRIVCSARWGSLGRQIEAQRRAALAKAQEPAHV